MEGVCVFGLPFSTIVADRFFPQGFDNLFDINHPVFCWLYRASFCWSAIQDMVRRVPEQIEAIKAGQVFGAERQPSNTDDVNSMVEEGNPADRSLLFRLLFLKAANNLARLVQQPLEKMGTLYSGVIDIGTMRRPSTKLLCFDIPLDVDINDDGDLELWGDIGRTFARGQALFLIRSVSDQESKKLKAAGYRFADPDYILRPFSNDLEMTKSQGSRHLEYMQACSEGERALAPGVHVACFMVRPVLHSGLGILVKQQARNVLPTTQLPIPKLEPWHEEFILRLDGYTLEECCEQLNVDYNSDDARTREFAAHLLKAMVDLRTQIDHPLLPRAILSARPMEVPSGVPGESSPLNSAVIIAFRLMLHLHPNLDDDSRNIPVHRDYIFQSWRFFACQQRVYRGYPHHGAFVRHMRQEIRALKMDDVPEARQSAIIRAQNSLRRLSRTAIYKVRRSETSRTRSGWTLPSSSMIPLRRLRSRTANQNVNTASTIPAEGTGDDLHIYDMLRTRPGVQTRPDNNDRAALDVPTYADILMRTLAQDRGPGGMIRVQPSF